MTMIITWIQPFYIPTVAKDRNDKEAEKEDDEKPKHTLEGSSASLDVAEQFSTHGRNSLKGTGTWLQEEPLFNTWVDQKAPMRWTLGGLQSWKVLSFNLDCSAFAQSP